MLHSPRGGEATSSSTKSGRSSIWERGFRASRARGPGHGQLDEDYVLSDNFFASVGGPSYPNHLFFVAGQSGGVLDNPENIEVRTDENGQFKSWGCDAVGDDVFVLVKDDKGNLTKHSTCFDFRTVPQQLEEIGVSWAYYSASPYQSGYFWNALNAISGVFHTDLWRDETIRPVDRIVDDIRRASCPPSRGSRRGSSSRVTHPRARASRRPGSPAS